MWSHIMTFVLGVIVHKYWSRIISAFNGACRGFIDGWAQAEDKLMFKREIIAAHNLNLRTKLGMSAHKCSDFGIT